MIRNTLRATQNATFAILLPDTRKAGMPSPMGTGFFVSPDGWFITAAHVITKNGLSDGPPRDDISACFLQKEFRVEDGHTRLLQFVEFNHLIPELDIALLKVDYESNKNKAWLEGFNEFPYIQISNRNLEEAEPVYSFGYPLSEAKLLDDGPVKISSTSLSPRVTSAIISSTIEHDEMITTGAEPRIYVLDKALNYGNSGGPIVSTTSGYVHAFCSRFQPQIVLQYHIPDKDGNPLPIISPSLYGVVISLNNNQIIESLIDRGVPITDN